MLFRLPILLLILTALLVPRAASGGQTPTAEPRYDPSTSVALEVVVTDMREVPRGNAMHGVHLTVDAGKETLDVYLGPADFMKQFDFNFAKGDRIEVTGSKVKTAAAVVVLAREVRKHSQTVYLRDSGGSPYWPPGS